MCVCGGGVYVSMCVLNRWGWVGTRKRNKRIGGEGMSRHKSVSNCWLCKSCMKQGKFACILQASISGNRCKLALSACIWHVSNSNYQPTLPHVSAIVGYFIALRTDGEEFVFSVCLLLVHKRKGSLDWPCQILQRRKA